MRSKAEDLTKDKDDKQLINASYKIDLAGAEDQVLNLNILSLLLVVDVEVIHI